jgi:hypothetical protein
MAKAIIHIGMNKTGSTFIQDVCSQVRSELAALSICYPVPRESDAINHVRFSEAHGFTTRFAATEAESAWAWNVMVDELPGPHLTLLLSAEQFSQKASDTAVGRLKTWLGAHGYDDVRIIVFLRNQVAWLISAYGQHIKGGRRETVEAFYRARVRSLVYSNLLAPWLSAFGQHNVIAVNYDAARRADRQHGIMDALWSAIGVDPADRAALAPCQPVRENSQHSQVLLEAMRGCPLDLALLHQGCKFAEATLERWRADEQRQIHDARIWPLPPDFLADLPIMQRDNDAVARAFGIPELPDLRQAALAYQADIVPVPETEVARCAALVRLGASVPTNRNTRPAAAAQMA